MFAVNTIIRDTAVEQMASTTLTRAYDDAFAVKVNVSKKLRDMDQPLPTVQQRATLEDFGFKRTVPAFFQTEGNGFTPNVEKLAFYILDARPLRAGEMKQSILKESFKAAAFGALTAVFGSQVYLHGLSRPTLMGAVGAIGAFTGYQTYRNAKNIYNASAVNTLGIGIEVYKPEESLYTQARTADDTLEFIQKRTYVPVLYYKP